MYLLVAELLLIGLSVCSAYVNQYTIEGLLIIMGLGRSNIFWQSFFFRFSLLAIKTAKNLHTAYIKVFVNVMYSLYNYYIYVTLLLIMLVYDDFI